MPPRLRIIGLAASVLFVLFTSSCSVSRPEFETTISSFRASESTGRLKEALAFYESQAQQAEKQATQNPSENRYWKTAAVNYNFAARAAKSGGDYRDQSYTPRRP